MLKIITEKIVIRGEKVRKIIRLEGCLEDEKLPQKYLDYCPRLEMRSVSELPMQWKILNIMVPPMYLREGDLIIEDIFQIILENIRKCGNRLHSITERLKKEAEGWKGEETIII